MKGLTRNRRKPAKDRLPKEAGWSSTGSPPARPPSDVAPHASKDRQSKKRWILLASVTAAMIVVVAGWGFKLSGGSGVGRNTGASVATFVGSEACAGCHGAEADLWRPSQHKLAMQHATDGSVLGDFNDASFDYYGIRSRFFRRDGKFLVETDGPDGKLDVFEVKYTFGVDPLQQYLIEFTDGRVQALSIAWDSRPKNQGGQRWFHFYPGEEIKHDDVLHWTKLNQNWNFMCAECHSTGVRKNYDADKDRFATSFAEISVGCEACHGQGSRHVGWAEARRSWWPFGKREDPNKGLLVQFDERRDVAWRSDPRTGNPQRSFTPATLRKEVETCGLCHARRAEFSEDWVPGRRLSDTHVVSTLARGLYHADGQMLDEVYNYGSFKQSKMFAAGVTCSDCHEPHGAKLRAGGDGVCLQCHASDKYTAATHHRHAGVEPALGCASCHMPVRTYMAVDQRHDHGFRVPRPDLSTKLETPNTCNDCHSDKSAQWAASAIEGWHGPTRTGFQKYAEAFRAAWTGGAGAADLLQSVASDRGTPAIARASALTELAARLSQSNITLARDSLRDPNPMVRIAALEMLAGMPLSQLWPLASPLLTDSIRGVRIAAASALAAVVPADLAAADRERFERAAAEFVAAQRLNADRPEARSTLAGFFARQRLFGDAETEYKAALRLSPQYTVATVNLADLYRQLGRDSDGESVLRSALEIAPRIAGVHHALGLTLTRLKRPEAALEELQKSAELGPDEARYSYVYAVALQSAGRIADAMMVLKENVARHANDRDSLMALVTFSRDGGDVGAALEYAERLARISPRDAGLAALIRELQQQTGKPELK
jgi:predicted CXXCH cytochrome family protein